MINKISWRKLEFLVVSLTLGLWSGV